MADVDLALRDVLLHVVQARFRLVVRGRRRPGHLLGLPRGFPRREAALEIGVPTYRFLRQYLDRRPAVPLTLKQVDPLIRQLTLYRDLIDRKTGETP